MPNIKYGNKTIEYSIVEKEGLKSHYITVERGSGVVLKGKPVSITKSQQLIAKKASWILDKLDLVELLGEDEIVTGSRIQYLGRKYYVEVFVNDSIKEITIEFTESKFKIQIPSLLHSQENLSKSFQDYFRDKAIEKITPRVNKWVKKTGLTFKQLRFSKLDKRWGACTPNNNITINIDTVKLPYSLIDYLIVHELVHTKIKNHSKEFWAELSKYIPNWKELDDKMYGMKL
jgi:hypothetical protein